MSPPPPSQAYPATYPAIGEVIDGKYQIERMLGEGGMGAVVKATHLLRRAPVALKFISPSIRAYAGAVERFLNEAVAASQIDCDHVVHVFDVGKLPSGAPYLVMEYMEGCDLSDLLAREGRPGLDVARAVHFTLQILRGLQVAHDAMIIHRDMKPSNCFVVTKEGEPDFVKLVDFGISKVQHAHRGGGSLTQTNSALGTPLYMSPEQARSPRDVDHRSDLYSAAVILYELLTGRTPFTSESGEFTEILFHLFTDDPPPVRSLRPDVPEGLAAVVHRGLARDPRDRYASAGEFAAALAPWADERSARVLHRLKSHVSGGRGSNFPSATATADGHAPPAAHFSRLQSGSTARLTPDTDPPPPEPPTAHGFEPPPGAGPTAPLVPPEARAASTDAAPHAAGEGRPAHISAYPPATALRVSTDAEAVAATQYGGANVVARAPAAAAAHAAEGTPSAVAPGKSTDLGATRDAPPPAAAKRRSPLLLAAPLIVVAALALATVGVVWKRGRPQPSAPTAAPATAAPDREESAPSTAPDREKSAPAHAATAEAASAESSAAPPETSAPVPSGPIPPVASASPSAAPAAPSASSPARARSPRQPPPAPSGRTIHLKDLKPVD